jgi:hypothetical protein
VLARLKYILKLPGEIIIKGSAVSEDSMKRQPNPKNIAIHK